MGGAHTRTLKGGIFIDCPLRADTVLEAADPTENKTDNMSLHYWGRETKNQSEKDTAWLSCEHHVGKQKGTGPQSSQGGPWVAILQRKLMGRGESHRHLVARREWTERQVPRPVAGMYSASPSQRALEMTLMLPERCVTTHGPTVFSVSTPGILAGGDPQIGLQDTACCS